MASLWSKLRERYVISVRNQSSFFESTKASLTVLEMLSLGLLLFSLIALLTFFAIKFTSLGQLVTPNAEKKSTLVELHERADSLENQVEIQQNYLKNMQRIIAGETIEEVEDKDLNEQEIAALEISEPTEKELELRELVNEREILTPSNRSVKSVVLFEPPISGVVTSTFDIEEQHFGVDIVAPKNTAIKSAANGKVLYSSWNSDDGYSMIITHSSGYISIYKHAEKLLKQVNDQIKSGEAIALIGNSGENTLGYHLHFELWKDGLPVNPDSYINLY